MKPSVLVSLLLASTSTLAICAPMQLTNSIPKCQMPSGRVLPGEYYKLEKDKRAFAWVHDATSRDQFISGDGWGRSNNPDMRTWFAFHRIDLNSDGICDWYLNALTPISTGGDRDSINTLYLRGSSGWTRIGADVPEDKPDAANFGKAFEQQGSFTYGEEPSVIHDRASKTNYVIAALYNRHVRRDFQPGYRIYDWDTQRKTLRLLDKWEPGSKAAGVYAFFKAHGARIPSVPSPDERDSMDNFDPEVESDELAQACNPESALRSAPQLYGVVSKHLLERCKR